MTGYDKPVIGESRAGISRSGRQDKEGDIIVGDGEIRRSMYSRDQYL